jgi:hypothetical protein
MKRNKILVVGLIALLMAGGLVLAGCDNDLVKCSREGKCEYRMAVLSGPSADPGVDNVCSDSGCNVYKQKSSGGASVYESCNCYH